MREIIVVLACSFFGVTCDCDVGHRQHRPTASREVQQAPTSSLKERLGIGELTVDSVGESQNGGNSGRSLALFLLGHRNRGRFSNRRQRQPTLSDMMSTAASEAATSVRNGMFGRLDRLARQRRMREASLEVLLIALLAARLANAAYAETRAELVEKLKSIVSDGVSGGFEVLHFQSQVPNAKEKADVHPQWFLARGALPQWLPREGEENGDGEALFLVFRGTYSMTDIIRDACISPEAQHGGCFHSGFLKGVRDDSELHRQLRRAIDGGCKHLYVFGHSLGGSLAMTLVAGNLLPTEYAGPVTVVGLGAPPVTLTNIQGDSVVEKTSTRDSPARFVLVVNNCDVVPRLLGSEMPVSTAALLASSVSSPAARALMERNVELLETMEQYSHPVGTEILLLKDGIAKAVPSSDHASVLHLHEAISPHVFDDHLTSSYARELEIAATLAEVFEQDGLPHV